MIRNLNRIAGVKALVVGAGATGAFLALAPVVATAGFSATDTYGVSSGPTAAIRPARFDIGDLPLPPPGLVAGGNAAGSRPDVDSDGDGFLDGVDRRPNNPYWHLPSAFEPLVSCSAPGDLQVVPGCGPRRPLHPPIQPPTIALQGETP
jgi:hypothetical protein